MLHLQTEFGDKIQILLVTADAPKGLGLHAWIDERGVYRAITYPESTTPGNVSAFLTSGKAALADYFVPDIENGDLRSWPESRTGFGSRLLRYSLVTIFDEKVFAPASLSIILKKDSVTGEDIGLNCFNLPIADLYRVAYFKSQNSRKYRVIVEARDLKKYSRPHDEQFFQWRKVNTYCYASKVPASGKNDVYSIMQKDLDEFFDIESSLRTMPVKKYALIRINHLDRIRSSGGQASMDIVQR